jgi:uncharacterized membrane protein YccC
MPRRRDPLDAVVGVIVGLFLGITIGFGFWWLLPTQLHLFPGDVVLVSVVVCGILGYARGDDFFHWIRDHWPFF